MASLRDLIAGVPFPLMGEKIDSFPLDGGGLGGGENLLSTTYIDPGVYLDEAASTLSPGEREQAMRLYRTTDRQSYVFAHAILRLLLSFRLEVDPCEIQFGTGKYGKPTLFLPRCDLCFNLSHANEAIAIGLAETPLGVDIDALRDDLDLDGIGQRFFTAKERGYLNCAPPGERRNRFFYVWTRKEALLKATGTGIDAIASVSVLESTVEAADESGSVGAYRLCTLSAPSGYSLALVLLTPLNRSSRA
jgi:phosphopantetheinyl transferase